MAIFAGASCQGGQPKLDISLGSQSWVAVTGKLWNVFPFTCYTGTTDTEMTPGDKVISQQMASAPHGEQRIIVYHTWRKDKINPRLWLEAEILDDIWEKWSVRAGVLQMTSLGELAGKLQGDNKYFKADNVSASSGEKG